ILCGAMGASFPMIAAYFDPRLVVDVITIICGVLIPSFIYFGLDGVPEGFRKEVAFGSLVLIFLIAIPIYDNVNMKVQRQELDERNLEQLKTFYRDAAPLMICTLKVEVLDEKEVNQLRSKAFGWAARTGVWINQNLGATAQSKFFDRSGAPNLSF